MELIMEKNNDFESYQKAKKEVQEIKSFYRHLMVSSIVMGALIYINLKFTPEVYWFLWVLLGTAIPIIFHGIKVFNVFPFSTKQWENKKIKQFMQEEKSNKNKFN
jgi:hypothetical protein